MLQQIIEEYLREREWFMHDCQYSTRDAVAIVGFRISRKREIDDEDEVGPLIEIEGRNGAAKIRFCKLVIDFHDPRAFHQLDHCLEVCERSCCDECPIKQWWLLSKNPLIVNAARYAE